MGGGRIQVPRPRSRRPRRVADAGSRASQCRVRRADCPAKIRPSGQRRASAWTAKSAAADPGSPRLPRISSPSALTAALSGGGTRARCRWARTSAGSSCACQNPGPRCRSWPRGVSPFRPIPAFNCAQPTWRMPLSSSCPGQRLAGSRRTAWSQPLLTFLASPGYSSPMLRNQRRIRPPWESFASFCSATMWTSVSTSRISMSAVTGMSGLTRRSSARITFS